MPDADRTPHGPTPFRPTRRTVLETGAAVAAVAGVAGRTSAQAQTGAGPTWSLVPAARAGGGRRVVIRDARGQDVARVDDPLAVAVKVGDVPVEHAGGYASVNGTAGHLTARGTLDTPTGSTYGFVDDYTVHQDPDGPSVQVRRTVTVLRAGTLQEMGFNSRFVVTPALAVTGDDVDLFLPGVRWGDTVGLPDGARGTGTAQSYVREMRLTLPFAALGSGADGLLVLSRPGARPRTNRDGYVPEPNDNWWINETIQFGSFGMTRQPDARLGFVYPAFEGDDSGDTQGTWNRRSHPVRRGLSHSYTLRLSSAPGADFPAAGRTAWRSQWALWSPSRGSSPAARVYDSGLSLLDGLLADYNGFPGLPFRSRLPSGDPDAVSYVMGFIGQQAPAGYQLLRAGVQRGDRRLTARGRSVIDFWVRQSPLPNGLPKLWINGDEPTWRDTYPEFLRVASDGMEGVLDAARLMRRHGSPVGSWETYLRRFGDFLISHQGDDGSFPRAWNADGSVNSPEKTNTSHPIRFLVGLAALTADSRYRDAAVRAGRFYRDLTAGSWHFVGGTADNPNVLDKEGGGLALRAFLALRDATGDASWLADARRAADYVETWNVAWPYAVDTPRRAYRDQGALGLGGIAAGGTGVDNWLTYESYDLYRLHLWTGDPHYLDVARFLTTTAYRTTQYRGHDVGYDRDGLVEEATTLADLVYDGVGTWLPWSTVAQLEPLSKLDDRFGSVDIDRIERLPSAERQRRNRAAG